MTRSGDGTASSGFGYTYDLAFRGRPFYRGVSAVLGDVEPFRVVAYGSAGGCDDARAQTEVPTTAPRV